jgi:hypothetical protein
VVVKVLSKRRYKKNKEIVAVQVSVKSLLHFRSYLIQSWSEGVEGRDHLDKLICTLEVNIKIYLIEISW